MEIFKNIDFISIQPKLYIKNKVRFKNYFGAFFSVILCLIVTSSFFYFLIDLFQYRKMKIIYNEEINKKPFINMTNFPFYFNVINNDGHYYDDANRIYKFTAIYYELYPFIRNERSTFQVRVSEIKIEKCSKMSNLLYSNMEKFIENRNDSFCINSKDLVLSGIAGDTKANSTFFVLRLDKCTNSSMNNYSCYPSEKIDSTLSKSSVYFSFIDFNYNNSMSIVPDFPYFKTKSNILNSLMVKQIKYYFSNIYYEIDDGLVFNSKNSNDIITQKDVEQEFSLLEKGSKTLLNINVSISEIKGFYYISYDKIVSIMANVGALWNFFYNLFSYFNNHFIEKLFFNYIFAYNKFVDADQNINSYSMKNKQSLNFIRNKKYAFFNNAEIEGENESSQIKFRNLDHHSDKIKMKKQIEDSSFENENKVSSAILKESSILKIDKNHQINNVPKIKVHEKKELIKNGLLIKQNEYKPGSFLIEKDEINYSNLNKEKFFQGQHQRDPSNLSDFNKDLKKQISIKEENSNKNVENIRNNQNLNLNFIDSNSINNNAKIRKRIYNYVLKKLSIEEILRKLIEIDRIKLFLFDREMLNNFKFLPGRNFGDNEMNYLFGRSNTKNSFKNVKNGQSAFTDEFDDVRQFWNSYEFD